jgi:hypothetical protein
MMVCNTQNYWVFGLHPSSGILEARKHNVSETGSVTMLKVQKLNSGYVSSLARDVSFGMRFSWQWL